MTSEKPLTEEEIADYREAFRNFDKDGNGEIDLHELGVVMRSLGYSPTDKQLKEMLAGVDEDGNGVINFDEFVAMMRKCGVETDFEKEIKQAFAFFDKDGNGHISPQELSEIMRGLGANLSDSEIDLLVKEADADGDGEIDVTEFLQVMYG
ncbi:unnamed protein product [Chrysoparadoxa australica]